MHKNSIFFQVPLSSPYLSDLQCFEYWCPDIGGPCVQGGDSSHAAVYCTGNEHCESLLLPNNVTGICEANAGAGERIPAPKEDQFDYYECVLEDDTDLWKWAPGSCDEDQIFSFNQ